MVFTSLSTAEYIALSKSDRFFAASGLYLIPSSFYVTQNQELFLQTCQFLPVVHPSQIMQRFYPRYAGFFQQYLFLSTFLQLYSLLLSSLSTLIPVHFLKISASKFGNDLMISLLPSVRPSHQICADSDSSRTFRYPPVVS